MYRKAVLGREGRDVTTRIVRTEDRGPGRWRAPAHLGGLFALLGTAVVLVLGIFRDAGLEAVLGRAVVGASFLGAVGVGVGFAARRILEEKTPESPSGDADSDRRPPEADAKAQGVR